MSAKAARKKSTSVRPAPITAGHRARAPPARPASARRCSLTAIRRPVRPAPAGGFFSGCAIVGGAFYPDSGNFPALYRGSYFFADLCNGFVARLDAANPGAAYAFGRVSGSPVGLLAGLDGALYVLTTAGITRFSAP